MLSAVDRVNVLIMQSVTSRTPLARVTLVNRNDRRLGYQFFESGTVGAVDLPVGSTGRLVLKKKGEHGGAALAGADSWTKEGSGATAIYWFTLSLYGSALGDLFGEGVESLSNFVLELTYIENGLTNTAPAIPCTVNRRYLQADEDLPDGPPDYPPAGNVLTKTEQELTAGEQSQVRSNLGLANMLCREAVDGPIDFESEGESGQFWFDAATDRLWLYVGGQFRYINLISAE